MEAPCAIRDIILQTPAGQPLAPPVAEHAPACPQCAEALWLQTLAAEAVNQDITPAGLIYWKAELRLRRERMEQAMRPTRALQAALPAVLTLLGATTAYYAEQPGVLIATLLFALVSVASLYLTRSA